MVKLCSTVVVMGYGFQSSRVLKLSAPLPFYVALSQSVH